MRTLPDASVDAVVTDPPYGINFMGKAWDGAAIAEAVRDGVERPGNDETRRGRMTERRSDETAQTVSGYGNRSSEAGAYDFTRGGMVAFQEWTRGWATEALRVLKPGGHLLSFSSPRTYHRMVVGIEDAGFQIRDSIHWLFGSGFPKNMDVAAAIDRHLGVDRDVIGVVGHSSVSGVPGFGGERYAREANDDGTDRVYQGIGSQARTFDKTVATSEEAKRWDGWGTALKPGHEPVVLARKPLAGTVAENVLEHGTGALNIDGNPIGTEHGTRALVRPSGDTGGSTSFAPSATVREHVEGRWPANLVVSHLPECRGSGARHTDVLCADGCPVAELNDDSGVGAARFFYVAKPTRRERVGGTIRNLHPTVKPMDLMRHLVRLVTPPGGLVLDPFLGSGTTGCACMVEGFRFVGCEREEEYREIATARISDYAFAHGRA